MKCFYSFMWLELLIGAQQGCYQLPLPLLPAGPFRGTYFENCPWHNKPQCARRGKATPQKQMCVCHCQRCTQTVVVVWTPRFRQLCCCRMDQAQNLAQRVAEWTTLTCTSLHQLSCTSSPHVLQPLFQQGWHYRYFMVLITKCVSGVWRLGETFSLYWMCRPIVHQYSSHPCSTAECIFLYIM